ncbi:putative Site-specific DNA-methyltransferase (adenine-specific) [Candidatus Accumulibacter aalborgensis]|uniref:site-specific DNA-methyltransferase (adenine-specific) n=1 Tax=Candidatus Accumulibacter aalborgensis TaxID=1860102 RepID=A0A1A8XFK6_9PROT|nr:putative Site-specific DNA-methyltransferase (adenine-specific) [Candidatus Accumulibacter aalborgensis]
MRNNMDAAEYKHVVLGLIFLKYISDAFEAKHAELEVQRGDGADPEDPDECRAISIFWVPREARWQYLKASAPQATIGTLVDGAMAAIERDNPSLKGVLLKDCGRAGLDKQRLGQIINLVSGIALGSAADRARDTLGRVYEYFLARFVSAEGKSGGQFYTPSHVVRVLWRDEQGYPQTQRLSDLPGVPDFVEHGALLGHLWMEGQLGVGDPLVDQGSPTRPLRAHKS